MIAFTPIEVETNWEATGWITRYQNQDYLRPHVW
jgi:hypothetical protein